jgi:hypothetical protein
MKKETGFSAVAMFTNDDAFSWKIYCNHYSLFPYIYFYVIFLIFFKMAVDKRRLPKGEVEGGASENKDKSRKKIGGWSQKVCMRKDKRLTEGGGRGRVGECEKRSGGGRTTPYTAILF